MSEHPIQGLMNTALQNIHEMMDVDTIIGKEIVTADGTVIIPVSKVSLGFASGGSDFTNKTNKDLFGGGSGAGGTIVPIAFLVVSNGDVKLLQISENVSSAEKAIALVPELFDKITGLFGKGKDKNKNSAKTEQKKEAEPILEQPKVTEAEAF
jgi:sporulation protein YtfJ